ncbi:hypothetical protein [Streptomyces noursei]|uniref:hypothetical protein n=1 Tax=Streptomyces noursei TaxID=1971 RepID=UPI0035DB00E6
MPDATIQLRSLKGIWRPVYAHRIALHSTADAIVLAAWKRDAHGLDLAPAVAAWQQLLGESADPEQRHRRQTAAAAVLGILTAWSWQRTRAAIALAAKRAHRAGWAAGRALVTQDHDDDTPYSGEPENPYTIGSPDMSDNTADGTATAVLTAALTATADRAGTAIADSTDDDPASDGEDTIETALHLALLTDAAVSAAYGAGMLAAYLGAGTRSVLWLTAGDGRVCERCSDAETGSPYSLLAAPTLPQHPNCRCCLAPA